MLVCGLKFTHDSGIAVFEDNNLLFSIEVEKINNRCRYTTMPNINIAIDILNDFGLSVEDIDFWVVDGWDGDRVGEVKVDMNGDGNKDVITVAPYLEENESDPLDLYIQGSLRTSDFAIDFISYPHVANHIIGAYGSSPFATSQQPSAILVWDGGMFPRTYYVDPSERKIQSLGELFPLIGFTYAASAQHFGPYKREYHADTVKDGDLAGKLMAYIAKGKPQENIVSALQDLYSSHFLDDNDYIKGIRGIGSTAENSVPKVHRFYEKLKDRTKILGVSDEDILASVHEFIEELLVRELKNKFASFDRNSLNLCLAGGCALNIKWNSAIRDSGLFTDIWVPPFPNDSGAALGAAAIEVFKRTGDWFFSWDVRSGPKVKNRIVSDSDWVQYNCTPQKLGLLLHLSQCPVVVINGSAELGPRALGGRSILASPTGYFMKKLLNKIKCREYYRPVAPICLEEHAPNVFEPGSSDPYMLFDHVVCSEWLDRIPAVVHLDNTARLQTVGKSDDKVTRSILESYYEASAIPVLCNTSANYLGKGFFPDVISAVKWGQVGGVWNENNIYLNKNSEIYKSWLEVGEN